MLRSPFQLIRVKAMVLAFLSILLLLTAWFVWRGRRRLGRGLGYCAVLLLLVIGCGPLPIGLLGLLQQPYAQLAPVPWQASNVIVVLGAGNQRVAGEVVESSLFGQTRMLRGAELYRDCKLAGRVCTVLISGGDANRLGHAEAQVYGDELLRLGVAPADLQREPRSLTTWQNAQFSAPLLQTDAPAQIVLVTSAFHLTRALLYFGHFGMHVVPVRSDYLQAQWSWLPTAQNLMLTDVALHEYLGIWRYAFYQRMGWNVKAARPGSP